MKRTLILIPAILALTACSTISLDKKDEPLKLGKQMEVVQAPAPIVAASSKPIDLRAEAIAAGIPVWYLKPPTQEGFIYGTGTAVSRDLEMSKEKALTLAQGKVAEAIGGKVSKQTRVFRADTGSSVVENSKSVIRKSTSNVDFMGTEVQDIVVKLEPNGNFRTYVLVVLPLGENNLARKQKLEEEMTKSMMANDKDDFEAEEKPAPQSSLKLLDVDNEEYKRRRDEALQKPNAVIGQITVR
jgi:hypothetical protein